MRKIKTKKELKVIVLTTLVLGSIGLSLWPMTNSRFIKSSKDETVLKFDSSMNNLYGGSTELSHETNSTGENLYLKLTFNRNEILRMETNENKTDTYYIEVPNYCYVYNNDVNSTMGSTELVLNNDMKMDINVHVDCVPKSIADDNSGNVTVPIKIYEKFSNEEKFIYWKFYYYGGTLDEYYDKVGYDPNPPVGEDPVLPTGYTRLEGTRTEIFSSFQTVINNYINSSGITDIQKVKDYIYPIDIDSEDKFFAGLSQESNILGLNFNFYEPTEIRENYILDYKIDPNIVGYALSYPKWNQFHFTTVDEDSIRNSLKKFLNLKYSADEAVVIYDYVITRTGGDVKGFVYDNKEPHPKSIDWISAGVIQTNSYTLPVALNFKTPNLIKIDYSIPRINKYTVFSMSLYASNIISEEILESMQIGGNYKDLRTSIRKNSEEPYEKFTDYFIYEDSKYDTDGNIVGNKKHLLIKVSSNPEVGNYNVITLESFESDLKVTFTNNDTDNTLDVVVVYENSVNEVDDVKTKLSTYFGLTLDDSNSTITEDVDTKTVTIAIKKDKILEAAEQAQSDEQTEKNVAGENSRASIPESEIISNMQVKFLSNKSLEGALNESLMVPGLNKTEVTSCPAEAGVQLPCLDIPVTEAKEDEDYSRETEIVAEPGITA